MVKTALLRAVSHDLRSPLTAISAAGEAVGSQSLSVQEREEMAAVIQEETRRLSRLVDNLLDLSRLEAGAAEPRREWTSVEELIGAALEELAAEPEDFALSIDRDLPLVSADSVQLERAFVNVLENARRHSGGHPVSVRARAVRSLAGEGGRLIVRIVDRGPGIPPAQLERVFEPFYRAGTAAGRPSRLGSGAGDRARLHRGQRRHAARRVAARAGSDVRVRAPAGGGSGVSTQGQPAPVKRPRVLVVDDEPQIVRALKVVLREAGFEAVAAETASEALDLAAVRPPEAAIVDLVLPDLDGIEVTRRLREWSEMPILVLSAVGEEEQKVRALEAGADDYITKPFGTRELVARLQAALRRAAPAGGMSRRSRSRVSRSTWPRGSCAVTASRST